MPRIATVSYEKSSGRLREIYDELIEKRGRLANVHTIQSLRPESIVKHIDLYMEIMFSGSELSRAQREMMAVVVSVTNGCEYCRRHHIEALNHYWKNDERCNRLLDDYKMVGLDEKDLLLCDFAERLTRNPERFTSDDVIEKMKDSGFSDSAILDATLVVSYFNFVNRIVLSLGVEDNPDERRDYIY